MGILSRFKDIMASNINAVFKKDEKNPEKAIEKYLMQLRADLGQVKAETAAHETEVRRAKMSYDENRAEAAKLMRYIEKASAAGNAADASIYSNKLDGVNQDGVRLEQRYNEAKDSFDKLAAMNDKLSTDISSLEGKLLEIKSKVEAAKAQQKMNTMAEKAGAGNPDEMFSRMNEKADYMLDRANAMAELDNTIPVRGFSEVEDLAEKYDNMSSGDSDIGEPDSGEADIAGNDSGEDAGPNDGTIDIF